MSGKEADYGELIEEAREVRDKALIPARYGTSFLKGFDHWRAFWANHDLEVIEALEACSSRNRELEEELERRDNELAELRERVSKNADLYRRDVQYALDLMSDVQKGDITIAVAVHDLNEQHQAGRKELAGWRMGDSEDG